jgi:hypothetical protein
MMNFRSDNEAGVHPLNIASVGRAFASGSPASFGEDEWTRRVERRFWEVFDKPDLLAFPAITGTVANAPAFPLLGVDRQCFSGADFFSVCAGFRTPAMMRPATSSKAGVGKASRHEIAGE